MTEQEIGCSEDKWVIQDVNTAIKIKELIESKSKPNQKLQEALLRYNETAPQDLKDFEL